MSEDLLQEPVIDLETLLSPIPGDNPSGTSLRYSGVYDEIAEARRADDDLNRGEWQTDLKAADFAKVIAISVPALSESSKDLQLAVWLAEALTKKHGFVGFRDALKLVIGFHERFWDTLYPEIEDGDMEGRANAIAWLDTQLAFAVKSAPFTGVAGYSFYDWEDSKKYSFPESVDSLTSDEQAALADLKRKAERERRVTASMWAQERQQTRRAACEAINSTVEECWAAITELNRLVEENYARNQTPGLLTLRKSLDDVHTEIKKLLEEKRREEPDEMDLGEAAEAGSESSGTLTQGAIDSRSEALKRLNEIAAFFHRTEPHSPVSYLVNRAVKWGNMPLESWLQDVIKDQSVLFQLRETLGFSTDGGNNGEVSE